MNLDSSFTYYIEKYEITDGSLSLCLEWNINLSNIFAVCTLLCLMLFNPTSAVKIILIETAVILQVQSICAKICWQSSLSLCFIVTRCISAPLVWRTSGSHIQKEKKLQIQIKLSHNALWGTVFHVVCSVVNSRIKFNMYFVLKKVQQCFTASCRSWVFLIVNFFN